MLTLRMHTYIMPNITCFFKTIVPRVVHHTRKKEDARATFRKSSPFVLNLNQFFCKICACATARRHCALVSQHFNLISFLICSSMATTLEKVQRTRTYFVRMFRKEMMCLKLTTKTFIHFYAQVLMLSCNFGVSSHY